MWSPNSAWARPLGVQVQVGVRRGSRPDARAAPRRWSRAARPGSVTIARGRRHGAVFSTATVRPAVGHRERLAGAAAPSRSKPEQHVRRPRDGAQLARRSASPAIAHVGDRPGRPSAPARSAPARRRAGRPGARPSAGSPTTVTTPVPPMPGIRIRARRRATAASASGSVDGQPGAARGGARPVAGLDQQERRAVALQAGQVGVAGGLVDPGLAAELGVAPAARTGSVDFSPQSPQPSHTRSLITTRSAGVGSLPRLRSRRSSVAHRSSWISTVTPPTAASSRCTVGELRRGGGPWRSGPAGTPR